MPGTGGGELNGTGGAAKGGGGGGSLRERSDTGGEERCAGAVVVVVEEEEEESVDELELEELQLPVELLDGLKLGWMALETRLLVLGLTYHRITSTQDRQHVFQLVQIRRHCLLPRRKERDPNHQS